MESILGVIVFCFFLFLLVVKITAIIKLRHPTSRSKFQIHYCANFELNIISSANTSQTREVVHEPTRNISQINRSGNDIYIIQQSTLPSYNQVIIDDLPTYEEIIRTKEELNRSER